MKKVAIFSIAAAGTLAGIGLLHAIDDQTPPTAPPPAPASDKGPKSCGMQRHHGGPGSMMGRRDHDGRSFRGGRPGGMMAGRGHHDPMMMGSMLNLTDDQKAKVKAIMEAQKPKFEAIRQEAATKMKALMEDTKSQIRPILTTEQQKVVDDLSALKQDQSALKTAAKPAATTP